MSANIPREWDHATKRQRYHGKKLSRVEARRFRTYLYRFAVNCGGDEHALRGLPPDQRPLTERLAFALLHNIEGRNRQAQRHVEEASWTLAAIVDVPGVPLAWEQIVKTVAMARAACTGVQLDDVRELMDRAFFALFLYERRAQKRGAEAVAAAAGKS